ncbi:flagellar motor protein MotB [Paraconexibacter sp.]|uniref:flagellar motor protein MotB n=1 Tax=Paraconexibacter sp. TaxID=2949640 RepID=UPI00356496F4
MASGRRKAQHDDHEEHIDESWLVSYADMMTLLVALFMVLFSISSVNVSKFEDLQRSLSNAFSGRVLPGGKGIQPAGGSDATASNIIKTPAASSIKPSDSGDAGTKDAAGKAEEARFKKDKEAVDEAVRERGLGGKIRTRISRRGLEVRLLTDDLLFASGSAVVLPAGGGLLRDIGMVLRAERSHPVVVEGHTDDVPIATVQYPTNWELSAARATGVVRVLAGAGVARTRLTAQGRADLDGIAANATEAGRALNRRVEILLPRQIVRSRAASRTGGSAQSEGFDAGVRPASPTIRPDATEASK